MRGAARSSASGVDLDGGVVISSQLAQEADQFAALCDELGAPGAAPLWIVGAHRIGFEDVIETSISRRLVLDSGRMLAVIDQRARPALSSQLVPIGDALEDPERQKIEVRSLRGRREAHAAHTESVRTLANLARREETRLLAVTLDLQEYACNAEVTVTATVPGVAPVAPFRVRFLLPVGEIEVELGRAMPYQSFSVDVPSTATVDVVGLRLVTSWSFVIGQLSQLVQAATPSHQAGPGEVQSRLDGVRANALTLSTAVRGVARSVDEVNRDPDLLWCRGAKVWTAPIHGVADELQRIGGGGLRRRARAALPAPLDGLARRVTRPGAGRVVRRRRRLLDAAKDDLLGLQHRLETSQPPPEFTVALKVERGVVQLPQPPIPSFNDPRTPLDVEVSSLIIPFSTEREPGTQGTRSVVLLVALAVLLLGVSTVDARWWWWDLIPLKRRPLAENDVALVVPLLVFFPAALYAQFFQTRPTTRIGARAQLGSFGVLSLIFALPLVPAVMAGTGGSVRTISILCVITAGIATSSAITVHVLFRRSVLKRLRRRPIRRWKTARSSGAESV